MESLVLLTPYESYVLSSLASISGSGNEKRPLQNVTESNESSAKEAAQPKRKRIRKLEPVVFFGIHPCPVDFTSQRWRSWRCAVAYADSVNCQAQALLWDNSVAGSSGDSQKSFSRAFIAYFDKQTYKKLDKGSSEVHDACAFAKRMGGYSPAETYVASQLIKYAAKIFAQRYHWKEPPPGFQLNQLKIIIAAYTHWGKQWSNEMELTEFVKLLRSPDSESDCGEEWKDFSCGASIKIANGAWNILDLFAEGLNQHGQHLQEQIDSQNRFDQFRPV